ncbi:MAG: rhomboid family intramembrane serine protease [Sulfobacillus sp.]
MARRHPVTLLLLVAITVVWVVEGGLTIGGGTIPLATAVALGAQYTPLVLAGQPWRLVTAMFIHWSWLHILLNGWSLYIVGTVVEPVYGSWRTLGIYLLGGLLGGVATLALMPQNVISAGASGAIFALLGAVLVVAIVARKRIGSSLLWWALGIVGINLLFDLYNPQIAIWDHLGGFLGGILATLVCGLPGRRWSWMNALAGALLIGLGAGLWIIA